MLIYKKTNIIIFYTVSLKNIEFHFSFYLETESTLFTLLTTEGRYDRGVQDSEMV